MSVRVTFTYEPDEPDDSHTMGISGDEYDRMTMELLEHFGADEVTFERVETEAPRRGGGPKK
jgi:hypothetical protein